MRIGFDGKRAVQNRTGLGNYSRYVLRALSASASDDEYWLYAPHRRENEELSQIMERSGGKMSLHYPPEKGLWSSFPALWRMKGITQDLAHDGITLYHGLSGELPIGIHRMEGMKSVVTVHDLIFRRLSYCHPLIDRLIYDWKCRYACRHADHIIAVSKCTKRDIIHYYGVPEEKISVFYQGCDRQFTRRVPEGERAEVKRRYGLPEQYILSVGTIERRKNALLALRALKRLPKKMHLVLVGKPTAYVRRLKAYAFMHGLQKRLHLLPNVPFADLPAIYQCATVFVYPSFYEGFGIPILEALTSGVPVVAATGSCLEEAGGPTSLYVDPHDAKGLAEAILRTGDPLKQATMVAKGLKWVSYFNEKRVIRELTFCYSKMME